MSDRLRLLAASLLSLVLASPAAAALTKAQQQCVSAQNQSWPNPWDTLASFFTDEADDVTLLP